MHYITPHLLRRLKGDEYASRKPCTPNVVNLQQRAAGVLPIRIDIPKMGTSHKFVRPLVVDEESVVAFSYKRR